MPVNDVSGSDCCWSGPRVLDCLVQLLKNLELFVPVNDVSGSDRYWSGPRVRFCLVQLLKNLEPYIAQGLSKVDQLKGEQQQSKEGLEAMIFSYRCILAYLAHRKEKKRKEKKRKEKKRKEKKRKEKKRKEKKRGLHLRCYVYSMRSRVLYQAAQHLALTALAVTPTCPYQPVWSMDSATSVDQTLQQHVVNLRSVSRSLMQQ